MAVREARMTGRRPNAIKLSRAWADADRPAVRVYDHADGYMQATLRALDAFELQSSQATAEKVRTVGLICQGVLLYRPRFSSFHGCSLLQQAVLSAIAIRAHQKICPNAFSYTPSTKAIRDAYRCAFYTCSGRESFSI